MASEEFERREEEMAAAEAARIGGAPAPLDEDGEPVDEAHRPLAEAGQGVAEGFEQSESELIERATHGDQHAARRAIADAPEERDDARAAAGGEGDHELSSEQDGERGRD